MSLIHSGWQVSSIPSIFFLLLLQVAGSRWVFKKRLLIFQAIPHRLGGRAAVVYSQWVPRGFLKTVEINTVTCKPTLSLLYAQLAQRRPISSTKRSQAAAPPTVSPTAATAVLLCSPHSNVCLQSCKLEEMSSKATIDSFQMYLRVNSTVARVFF